MSAIRTEKISVLLTPAVLARLDEYRDQRRWTRSTAIADLVEKGLARELDSEDRP